MARPATDLNFGQIFGNTSPLTPYTWSNSDYSRGWYVVGSTPPSMEEFDALQRLSDKKAKYLYDCVSDLYELAETPPEIDFTDLYLPGNPTADTPSASNSSKRLATTEYVTRALSNYDFTDLYLPGNPTADTPAASNSSKRLATTEYVTRAISNYTPPSIDFTDLYLPGKPTADTPTLSDNSTRLATTNFVRNAINEYASSGDTEIDLTDVYLPGSPTAETPPQTANNKRLATTAYVRTALANYTPNIDLTNVYLPGKPTADTPASTENSTRIATTAFVQAVVNSIKNSSGGGGSTETAKTKLTGVISITPSNITLTNGASTTVTVTYNGDGTLSTPTNPNNATLSKNGSTVTVTATATGTSQVTFAATESSNYTAASATLTITVNAAEVSKKLSDCTPAQIQEIVRAGQAAQYWDVGDKTATITLNGKIGEGLTLNNFQCHAVILGFDHNKSVESGGNYSCHFIFAKSTNGADIAFVDSSYDSYVSDEGYFCHHHRTTGNEGTNSGGWNGSYIRTTILNNFLNAIPSEWKAIFSNCTKYTDNVGNTSSSNSSSVTATQDKLFLLSEFEIFGVKNTANAAEQDNQDQYSYYKNGNSKQRYKHNSTTATCIWWTRSTQSSNSVSYSCVRGTTEGAFNSHRSLGIAPAFMVA